MTAFIPEVPGHVQYSDHVENNVQVRGGTNWDVSRSAIATPIEPVKAQLGGANSPATLASTPYVPSHRIPDQAPFTTVQFSLNSAVIPPAALKVLAKIPKNATVVLAGHADPDEKAVGPLSKKRAETVSAALRKRGVQVEYSKYFSADLPLAQNALNAKLNRRVEVFTDK